MPYPAPVVLLRRDGLRLRARRPALPLLLRVAQQRGRAQRRPLRLLPPPRELPPRPPLRPRPAHGGELLRLPVLLLHGEGPGGGLGRLHSVSQERRKIRRCVSVGIYLRDENIFKGL